MPEQLAVAASKNCFEIVNTGKCNQTSGVTCAPYMDLTARAFTSYNTEPHLSSTSWDYYDAER